MVKLRWLQVNKFRSVKPGTRLTFNPGYNVLLGQNGTGKTTLLNLVAAVMSSKFDELKGTDFDLSYEVAFGENTVTVALRHERQTRSLEADFMKAMSDRGGLPRFGVLPADGNLQNSVRSAEIRITSAQFSQPLLLSIDGSHGKARYENASPDSAVEFDPPPDEVPFWFAILNGWSAWAKSASATQFRSAVLEMLPALSMLNASRFDESLEYFVQLGDLSVELNQPDQFVSGFLLWRLLGAEFANLARTQWGADRYVLQEDQIPFLKKLRQLIDFESAEAVVDLQESNKSADKERARFGNLRFFFTHRGGWKISEKHLSYGQKRMLAFMVYLATTESVAIADELVNGLHHHWIRACIEAMDQRQVFLTSQNPLLLDYLTFESPEEVRSKFILCRWDKDTEHMGWENMSQEAAEDFFASYKVGFQQVGELLQSKGLW
jgi:energy-coupling factor transporter ATP-binding protein EcfA2